MQTKITMKQLKELVKETVDGDAVDEVLMEHGNEYLSEKGYDNEYYDMADIDELLSGKSATDILLLAYNGGNYGAGGRKDGEFNPNAEYFAFDGYANLLSISEYGLKDYINNHIDRDEFIDWAIEQGYLEEEDEEEEEEEY